MDLDEFKNLLRAIKKDYGTSIGLTWRVPILRPKVDFSGESAGWNLAWAATFNADAHYLCLREDWAGQEPEFKRRYFSYHYGPYTNPVQLERLEHSRPKQVIVRIDAISYYGRGFHIHDGAKNNRIYQDQLTSPTLGDCEMPKFIDCITKIRQGRSVSEAFDLKFI